MALDDYLAAEIAVDCVDGAFSRREAEAAAETYQAMLAWSTDRLA